jgi:hypothetical protein
MFHYNVLITVLLGNANAAPFLQSDAIQRAESFRTFVRSQPLQSEGASQLQGAFRSIDDKGDRWLVHFADGSVSVRKEDHKVSGFHMIQFRKDESWISSLTVAQRRQLVKESFVAAGFTDQLTFLTEERWGPPNAEFPGGAQSSYRISCRRSVNGVKYGLYTHLDFDLDAKTGQLLGMAIVKEPLRPTTLSPLFNRDQALAIIMGAYFADNPGAELAENMHMELCIWDAKFVGASPGAPAYVQEAASQGRGILAYEVYLDDLAQGSFAGRPPSAYAVLNARTGQFIFRGSFQWGLGANASVPKKPMQWNWGPAVVTILHGKRVLSVQNADITETSQPKSYKEGVPLQLRCGRVTVFVQYHKRETLVSRQIRNKRVFGKPNANLLKGLKSLIK